MAGENLNLINPQSPRDWGHHKSPFFKFPPEIRNKIYREAFAGSDIALVLDPPLHVNVVPVTGRRSIFINVSAVNAKQHFLLTCVQVYLEALAIYWTNTVVRNSLGNFSRGLFMERIPAIARPYIQHLRDVNAVFDGRIPRLRGEEALGWRFMPLAETLTYFPNLKSCSVWPWSSVDSLAEIQQAVARVPNVHIVEKQLSMEWGSHVAQVYALMFGATSVRRIVFVNHTTGRKITWAQPDSPNQWFPDEACIEGLMDPVPSQWTLQLMRG